MKALRLVVWGLGRHAVGRIVPAVAAVSGLDLHGVCSRSPASVASSTAQWKCRGWTDPESMLKDPSVDIVYVASPIALHAEHGRQVLEAGKHLWCEKPFTSRATSTRQLVELSRKHDRSICEGHMYLHHPQFRQLSSYIAGGRIGSIMGVAFRFGIPRLEHPGFRADPALDGGALFDVGCYPVSAVQALFPDATHRLAHSRVCWRDKSGIDTDGYAVLELSTGAVATLEWRRNVAYRNEIDVWGDRGSLFTDKIFSKSATYVPIFRFRDAQGAETTESGQAGDHFVAMLRDFREMIDDPAAIDVERGRVLWRAEVVDQIWSAAGRL